MNQTHLIMWKKKFVVEWGTFDNGDQRMYEGKMTFHPGDVIACNIEPDGIGHKVLDYPVCDLSIAGGIDLWNVADSDFEIISGPKIHRENDPILTIPTKSRAI